MSPDRASTRTPDTEKTKDQLLSELQELRDRLASLKESWAEDKSLDVARNSAERKNVEDAINDVEDFNRSVLDALPSNIAVLDENGVIIYTNQAWKSFGRENSLCCDDAEWIGINYFNVCRQASGPHSEEAPEALRGMLSVLKGDAKVFELEYPCHSPDIKRWFQMRVTPFHSRISRGIIVVHSDITARKTVEEALRESERRYRAIYEQAPLGVALIDSRTGRFMSINSKYCEIVGRAEHEMLNTTFMAITYPDDLREDLDNMARLLAGKIQYYNMEKRYVRNDGSIVWANLTVVPLWEDEGQDRPKFHLAMIEDITERKRAEEALIEAKSQAELYVDLMGHDINNMNQAGMGYLELLQGSASLSETDKQYLIKALEVLHNSSNLIDNVRKLQSIKKHELKYQHMDVCELLKEVRSEYLNAPDDRVAVNIETSCHCTVNANGLLKDVFRNILGNAIKHSTGNVTIDIKSFNAYEGERKYCKVTIEDNGPGIPDEMKEILFNRFRRGTTKTRGRGLGLYLSRALIEDFGGRIWVEDRVLGDHKKGARFVVMLPVVEKDTSLK